MSDRKEPQTVKGESRHTRLASLLTEREAARLLCVSPYLLQKWRWKGIGPKWVRVGGPTGRAVRYRLADIEEYLTENTVETLASRGTLL